MKKLIAFFAMLVLVFAIASPVLADSGSGTGFDQFGYNYGARIFVGPADGVDRNLDGTVWGDPTYANDQLVMKWNAQWDNCNTYGRYSDPTYCLGAWDTNYWNGMVPGGSGYTEIIKIIWVGPLEESSSYWVPNGSPIWGNYEILMDQGTGPDGHTFYTFAAPNGLH